MNSHRRVMDMLTDKRDDGEYKIPKIIYADAYSSEMVARTPTSILPDTTYLERHDCISACWTGRSASWMRRRGCHPLAGRRRRRHRPKGATCAASRPFSCSSAHKLGLSASGRTKTARQSLHADYADYIVNHQRRPGVGPLAGFRGEDGTGRPDAATPNPDQLATGIRRQRRVLASNTSRMTASTCGPSMRRYQDWAVADGLLTTSPSPYRVPGLCRDTAQVPTGRRRARRTHQPPEHLRDTAEDGDGSAAGLVGTVRTGRRRPRPNTRYHAITQRPAAMYHAWGSQNAWLRQIHGENPMYVPGRSVRHTG